MEGCLARAVRLLALFIAFCFLLVTADCVAGLMLYRYAPGWYEDFVDLASPGADGREHERRLALDRPTRRLIQQGLANDGFDPGTLDGQFGPRTRAAIRAWQAARGAATTGYLDEVQAELLRNAAALQPEALAGVAASDYLDEVQAELLRRAAALHREAPAGLDGSEFFTRGSHQDEVLRLQGTPDSIWALSTSETWHYGSSSVTISTRSREVTEWSNHDGNLRVRLVPGPRSSGPPRAAEPAPGAVFRPGTDIVPPRLLREVKPQYTAEAMRAKIQGTVWVEVVVLPDGTVGDIRITKSLDPVFGLDQQAIDAVRQWRFAPGTRFGEPVPVLVGLELYFNLRWLSRQGDVPLRRFDGRRGSISRRTGRIWRVDGPLTAGMDRDQAAAVAAAQLFGSA